MKVKGVTTAIMILTTDATSARNRNSVQPENNLTITQDTRLCADNYNLRDPGRDGAIRVTGNNVTLDCRDSELVGVA